MNKFKLDMDKYKALARQAAAESCVLVRNDNGILPIRKTDKVAVFGRAAFNYYKSGLGSGGLVNTSYVVGILDALKEDERVILDGTLLDVYKSWIEENPYDHGGGWGTVPWSQKEMPLDDSIVEAASHNDIAIVVIGRTAGEDQDTKNSPGSYQLSDLEADMIKKAAKVFTRVAVILNVGNIIDMKWAESLESVAIVYAWQGGQEGGNGVKDILLGDVNPSGKLTDTIAYDIDDYPSSSNFGDLERNIYAEDIYVGYRYFETFAKDKVVYPFGHGLSYTTFDIQGEVVERGDSVIEIEAEVKNTGKTAGKEVVQIYLDAPQGMLGKPSRSLVGYKKTGMIEPGSSKMIRMKIPYKDMASFDDSGVTGFKSSFVLEEGRYDFYLGNSVRTELKAGSVEIDELKVIDKLSEACSPTVEFDRMRAVKNEEGSFELGFESVPVRTEDPNIRKQSMTPVELPYTGDRGYKLGEVFKGTIDMDSFVSQLSDLDMIHMFRGEGMCSPKVTPGTAAAFGGTTKELEGFGIPVACCADGPSGIRMDCGTLAFSLPNGTALGCTFNDELVENLFEMLGLELRKNKIDTLLGPGMNIHRNPLNGRNFEYISEDPLLTGKISAAQILGLEKAEVTGTIKHFSANNQEAGRHTSDSVVSQRALREIYLKGFEIAVKEGGARSVMTTYGALNGLWTAGSFDLCTVILRKEWGFKGIVMSDWWAKANIEGQKSDKRIKAPMVSAQNDLYMCVNDAVANPENDDLEEKLEKGDLKRSELQRNTKNILDFILQSVTMKHYLGLISQEELDDMESGSEGTVSMEDVVYYAPEDNKDEIVIDGHMFNTERGVSEIFGISVEKFGKYEIEVMAKSDLNPLAQLPISVYFDNIFKSTVTLNGSEGKTVDARGDLGVVFGPNHYIKLYFGAGGLQVDKVIVRFVEAVEFLV